MSTDSVAIFRLCPFRCVCSFTAAKGTSSRRKMPAAAAAAAQAFSKFSAREVLGLASRQDIFKFVQLGWGGNFAHQIPTRGNYGYGKSIFDLEISMRLD